MKKLDSGKGGAYDFSERCRQVGLPLTAQRRAVYEILAHTTSHPSADTVYTMAREKLPHISRTSVFRILDTFSVKGLIKKIETPESAARYDGNIAWHCHTFCDDCGAIGDWHDAPFDRSRCPDQTQDGFVIFDCSCAVRGLCSECAKKRKTRKNGRGNV